MRIKFLLVFCMLFALTESSHAQFGIISAIKKKVEKNKEEKMTPEEKEIRDKEKREKEMAEIKKRTFPDKKMEDPLLEKYLLKLIQQNEKLKSKKVEALHIDNNDWIPTTYSVWDPNLKRMSDPKITGVDLKVAIGYRENGYCYKQNVIFKRDALGGGQFQKNGYLQSIWDAEEILCEELDAAIQKDNADLPVVSPASSLSPASVKTSASPKAALKPGTEIIDLSSIGIDATMVVPAGVKAVEGKWSNSIKGPNDFEISIENTSLTIEQMKTKTQTDKLSEFKKFLATDANGYTYSCALMGNTLTHFEYIITLNGVTYRFYDARVKPLAPAQLQPMYDAIKTITVK